MIPTTDDQSSPIYTPGARPPALPPRVIITPEAISNVIIHAANPIIVTMVQIKRSAGQPDVDTLREHIANEIILFEQKLMRQRINERIVASARYCLCTAIDEAILSTLWGPKTAWAQHSLLAHFHNDTWGGERFYLILDTLAQDPESHLAVLEFLYLLLSLGFEGKYFENNGLIREEIRHRLHTRIKQTTGKSQRQLARNTRDPGVKKQNQTQRKSLNWIRYLTATSLLGALLLSNIMLTRSSTTLRHTLNHIGQESPITAYSQLIDRAVVSDATTRTEL